MESGDRDHHGGGAAGAGGVTDDARAAETVNDETTFPGAVVAYDFVLPSYQLLVTRLEAQVTRIQTLMQFAATIMLGFPVLAKAMNDKIAFWSAPFIGAVGFFIVLMIVGIVARDFGTFTLVNPGRLYKTWLHLAPHRVKMDLLYFAGEHFEKNNAVVTRKSDYGRVMSALLLAEVLSFVWWVAR